MKKIVLISGGKDSTATLFRVLEMYPREEITGIFQDTHWEHSITYKYIKDLEKYTGIKIYKTESDKTMIEIIKKTLPTDRYRHCTTELKTKPFRKYIRGISDDILLFYGLRREESKARAIRYENIKPNVIYEDKRYSTKTKQKVYAQYPIIDWSEKQVREYIISKGFYLNTLYLRGFSRVGCFPCINMRKSEIKLCLKDEEGRKNIKAILDTLDDWENIKKRAEKYYRMKNINEEGNDKK